MSNFNKKPNYFQSETELVASYSSEKQCVMTELEYRMSPDRRCFNPKCKASIDQFYKYVEDKKSLRCGRCFHYFHTWAGSELAQTKLPRTEVYSLIVKMMLSRNGIAALEVSRIFGRNRHTVIRVMRVIRKVMKNCLDKEVFSSESYCEVDESYVKTGNKGFSRHFYHGRGRGSTKHTSILAIVERKGMVKFFKIPTTSSKDLIPKILENVPLESPIFTDSWSAYGELTNLGYFHGIVDHSQKEYVRDSASTNAAENVFSNFKRSVTGTYRNLSDRFLEYYLWESAFRHTYRFESDYGLKIFMQSLGSLSDYYNRTRYNGDSTIH